MVNKPRPARPLQEIAANLHYHAGRSYLVFVDRCSKGAVQPHNSTRYLLVRWGPPVHFQVIQDFSIQWVFSYQMASPLSTQQWKGWGYCKAMKKIIHATWNGGFFDEKLYKVLLQYRNTPSTRGRLSPAQKLFRHPIQDTIPAHSRSFTSEARQCRSGKQKRIDIVCLWT